MKKKLSLSFILIFTTFLNATILLDYYHKDYIIADRSVFVFDGKPECTISNEDGKVFLKMLNTQKDLDIENKEFSNEKIISGIDYLVSGKDLIATINLFSSKDGNPKIEEFGYKENRNIYKFVIDIIAIPNPTTTYQAQTLANFYKLTGNEPKAKSVLENFEKTSKALVIAEKKQIIPIEKTEKTKVAQLIEVKPQNPSSSDKRKKIEIFKRFNLSFYLIIIFAIFLIIFGIKLLKKHQKNSALTKEKNTHVIDEFGSISFRKTVAQKLQTLNWNDESIARELQITKQDAKKLLEEIE